MRLLALLLLAVPASANNRSSAVPGVVLPGGGAVSAAGPAAILPALPALPSGPAGLLPAAAVLPASAVPAMPAVAAAGAQSSGAQAGPAAQAALTGLSAAVAASAEKGESPAAPLKAAFDGSFKKGSLEGSFGAPPPGPGGRVDLSRVDTADTRGMRRKKAERRQARDQAELDELQQVLYADRKRRVLVVLQAMDTGGKDGTIRKVFRGLNPQGVEVTTFKKPTEEEARQHYLKRIKAALPGAGMIGVFNRSHYEDILVPTVLETHSAAEVERRYAEINAFEKELADQGWTIVKFFLHISKGEQRRRLQARLDQPDKNWKFSPEDLKTRKLWGKYQRVYEKILGRTSTPWAPWFIIPADNKWYRDYAVTRILKKALKRLDLRYPDPAPDLPKTIPK